jgi:hypothetical protein
LAPTLPTVIVAVAVVGKLKWEERDRLLADLQREREERQQAREEARKLREELEAERGKGFWRRLLGG